MTVLSLTIISLLTIVASTLASVYVNVSRERLWLRASKAEALYRAIEAAYAGVSAHFGMKPDPAGGMPLSHEPDLAALIDVKLSVGLYFPEVKRELAELERALQLFLRARHVADLADPLDNDGALGDLDAAFYELKDAFSHLKAAVLRMAEMKESWIAQKLRRDPMLASQAPAPVPATMALRRA